MMAVLVTATVIAILYFAREVFVPITLAILLSFLLAPAVRWLRRLQVGRVTAVGFTALFAFIAIAAFAAVVVGRCGDSRSQVDACACPTSPGPVDRPPSPRRLPRRC